MSFIKKNISKNKKINNIIESDLKLPYKRNIFNSILKEIEQIKKLKKNYNSTQINLKKKYSNISNNNKKLNKGLCIYFKYKKFPLDNKNLNNIKILNNINKNFEKLIIEYNNKGYKTDLTEPHNLFKKSPLLSNQTENNLFLSYEYLKKNNNLENDENSSNNKEFIHLEKHEKILKYLNKLKNEINYFQNPKKNVEENENEYKIDETYDQLSYNESDLNISKYLKKSKFSDSSIYSLKKINNKNKNTLLSDKNEMEISNVNYINNYDKNTFSDRNIKELADYLNNLKEIQNIQHYNDEMKKIIISLSEDNLKNVKANHNKNLSDDYINIDNKAKKNNKIIKNVKQLKISTDSLTKSLTKKKYIKFSEQISQKRNSRNKKFPIKLISNSSIQNNLIKTPYISGTTRNLISSNNLSYPGLTETTMCDNNENIETQNNFDKNIFKRHYTVQNKNLKNKINILENKEKILNDLFYSSFKLKNLKNDKNFMDNFNKYFYKDLYNDEKFNYNLNLKEKYEPKDFYNFSKKIKNKIFNDKIDNLKKIYLNENRIDKHKKIFDNEKKLNKMLLNLDKQFIKSFISIKYNRNINKKEKN